MDVIVGNAILSVPENVCATSKKGEDGGVWSLDLEFTNFTGRVSLKRLIERSVSGQGGEVVGIVRGPPATTQPATVAPTPTVVEEPAPVPAKPEAPEPVEKEKEVPAPAPAPAPAMVEAAAPVEAEVAPVAKKVEEPSPKVATPPKRKSKLTLSKPKKQLRMSDFGVPRKDGLVLDMPMTNGAAHAYKKREGVRWEAVEQGDMVARCGATAALDASGDRVYVCGGLGEEGYLDDLWILDAATWQWTKGGSSGFKKRAWHTSSMVKDKLLVFGGQCDKPQEMREDEEDETMLLGELALYDFESGVWFDAHTTGEAPCPRSGHSATPVGETKLVVFGGMNDEGKFMNDVSVLDTVTWQWTKPKTKGSPVKPRGYHTAILVGKKIVFFGGIGKCNWAFKEIYTLDTETWKWQEHSRNVQGEHPTCRVGQVVTALLDGKSVLVQGGHNPDDNETCYDDAYVLDTQSWRWVKVEAGEERPTARAGHCGVVVNGVLATFFGQDGQETKMRDVWKLDLEQVMTLAN